MEVISRQIANAHTLFNLTMTVVWVCLLGLMVKIVMWLIPDAKDAKVNPLQPAFLDKKVIGQPTVALEAGGQGSAALQWNGKKYAEGSGRA